MIRKVVLGLVLALIAISLPAPVAVGKGQDKVDVCHFVDEYWDFGDGEEEYGVIISIAKRAKDAHIAHGDPEGWVSSDLPDGRVICRATFTVGQCPCWQGMVLEAFSLTRVLDPGAEPISSTWDWHEGPLGVVHGWWAYDEPPDPGDHYLSLWAEFKLYQTYWCSLGWHYTDGTSQWVSLQVSPSDWAVCMTEVEVVGTRLGVWNPYPVGQ